MVAGLANHALVILLASLRLAPLVAFAPPFTLVNVPATVRVVIVMVLATCLPGTGTLVPTSDGALAIAAGGELALGLTMALPLQLAFGLIGMAGRALDIQAGFGLAFLLDPKTKAQMPLIGALFIYAAAAVFFLSSGPDDLLAVMAAGFAKVPIGTAVNPDDPGAVVAYMGAASVIAMGLVGIATVALFLIDLVIAMLSRTLPQMNVLVFGFQVKSLVTLVLMPLTLAYAGAGMLRLIRLSLETMPQVMR